MNKCDLGIDGMRKMFILGGCVGMGSAIGGIILYYLIHL
jgi:hypothetical protein